MQNQLLMELTLPPSWGGRYRTRQNTIKGYPELVAKQLEQFIRDEFRKCINGSN